MIDEYPPRRPRPRYDVIAFGPKLIMKWSYEVKQHPGVAGIKTAGGVGNDWVGKTIADVTIKGQGNDLVLDLSKVHATAPGSYPILLASYQLVCSKYPDAQVGTAVKTLMQSTVTTGQQGLTPLGYIPFAGRLPDPGCRCRQQHHVSSSASITYGLRSHQTVDTVCRPALCRGAAFSGPGVTGPE